MSTSYNGQMWEQHDGCGRFKVKGSITALIGDIAVFNGGYLDVGQVATSLKIVGTFAEPVNTTGASDGDVFDSDFIGPQVNLDMDKRLFWFENSTAGDAIAQADIGKKAYINGARKVTDTSTGRSVAGSIVRLSTDAAHVLVRLEPLGVGL
jgi:hypothetical protein